MRALLRAFRAQWSYWRLRGLMNAIADVTMEAGSMLMVLIFWTIAGCLVYLAARFVSSWKGR